MDIPIQKASENLWELEPIEYDPNVHKLSRLLLEQPSTLC